MSDNASFRQYVTSVAFHISLSRVQLEHLVGLEIRKRTGSYVYFYSGRGFRVDTYRTLANKGFATYKVGEGPRITKVGLLLIDMLKEAGMYDEIVSRCSDMPEKKSA